MRSLLITWLLLLGAYDLFGEDLPSGFKTPSREDPQDLLTEKKGYYCIFPLLILNLVLPYVFGVLAFV